MRNSVYPGSHHRSTSRNVTTYSMDELTRSSAQLLLRQSSLITAVLADADEFIKLVARGLNRYNIIKRETYIQLKNITIRLTEKEHN